MKTHKRIILLILLPIAAGFSQYWGEQVLEKSFEKSDIFFHSQDVNPYGIQGFGDVMVGILNDPLLLIQLNPANMASDSLSRHYLYTDFRNDREIKDKPNYFYPWYDCYAYSSCIMPYYSTYSNTRKAQEPIFSGAYLFRPNKNKYNWTLGITYQMISQDEDYYAIPQDIYRSNIGYDYSGNKVGAAESSVPVTDVYSGQDDMHQESHIISFLSGIQLKKRWQLGARLNRTTYNRDGGYGNYRNRNNAYYTSRTSQSRDWTTRDQAYDHWDISAGLQYQSGQNDIIGITAGYLDGTADQNLESMYDYDYLYDDNTDYYSRYFSQSLKSQTWDHQGNTSCGGINLSFKMDEKTRMKMYYKYMKEDVDLTNASTISDTSYSEYHNTSSDWSSDSHYISALSDSRTGFGNRDAKRHYFTMAFEMKPDLITTVHFGIHLESHYMTTKTTERVTANNFSDSWRKYDNAYEKGEETIYRSRSELKTLQWELSINSSKIQIPVMIERKLTQSLELLFGLNRTYNKWTIKETTLAVFDYRNTNNNGTLDNKNNFGERYTEPTDIQSDVSTAFLLGLVVKPADPFQIRLIVVPEYLKTVEGTELSTLQWWIGFQLKY